MKKYYFMLRSIFALTLLVIVSIIGSCRKETITQKNTTDSKTDYRIANAKAYLDSNLKINSAIIKVQGIGDKSEPTQFDGYLQWDKAKSSFNKNFEVVEIPARLDYKQINFYNLVKDTSTVNTKKAIAEGAFVRACLRIK